jgi:hypothetical protein
MVDLKRLRGWMNTTLMSNSPINLEMIGDGLFFRERPSINENALARLGNEIGRRRRPVPTLSIWIVGVIGSRTWVKVDEKNLRF